MSGKLTSVIESAWTCRRVCVDVSAAVRMPCPGTRREAETLASFKTLDVVTDAMLIFVW